MEEYLKVIVQLPAGTSPMRFQAPASTQLAVSESSFWP